MYILMVEKKHTRTRVSVARLKSIRIIAVIILLAFIFLGLWSSYLSHQLIKLNDAYSYVAETENHLCEYEYNQDSCVSKTDSASVMLYRSINSNNNVLDIENSIDGGIFSSKHNYGINKITRKHVPGYGDRARSGFLFGPVGVDDQGFVFWHPLYDIPIEMEFDSEEEVYGLSTHHYKSTFDTNIGNNPDTAELENGLLTKGQIELWVEPRSGHLVNYSDISTVYRIDRISGLIAESIKYYDYESHYSNNSIYDNINIAKLEKRKIELVQDIGPIIICLAIVALVISVVFKLNNSSFFTINFRTCAMLVSVLSICVIVLFSWLIRNIHLIRPFNTSAGMHPFTALFFICLSFVILMKVRGKITSKKQIVSTVTLLAAIFTISLLNITGNVLDFGIVIQNNDAAMAPATAAGFILVSVILAIRLKFSPRSMMGVFNTLLVFIVLVASLGSIIGYAFDFSFLHKDDLFSALSVSTAFMFLLLSLVLIDHGLQLGKSSSSRRLSNTIGMSVTVTLIALISSGITWRGVRDNIVQNASIQYQEDVLRIERLLKQQLDGYFTLLEGTRNLHYSSDSVTNEDWQKYIEGLKLNDNYPGNQGVGYIQLIDNEEDITDFNIISVNDFPGRYIDLYGENGKSFDDTCGQKLYLCFETISTAQSLNSIAVSSFNDSEEFQASESVLLIFFPVYADADSSDRNDINNIAGFVYSSMNLSRFLDSVYEKHTSGVQVEIAKQIVNMNDSGEPEALYRSVENPGRESRYEITNNISIANEIWQIKYSSLPGVEASINERLSSYVLTGGLALSFLLGVTVYGLSNSRQRAIALAEKITEDLKREKNNAVKLKDRDEAIIISIGDGLILFNSEGKIERVNEAGCKILGYKEKDFIGDDFEEKLKAFDDKDRIIPRNHRPAMKALLENINTSQKVIYYQKKDGGKFPAKITVSPVMNGSKIVGAVEIFRDMTDEQKLDRAKDEFIDLASHQLRTPLTATKWFVEIFLESKPLKLTEEQVTLMNRIGDSTEHMIELVRSLLNVSRIESGRLNISPELIKLPDLINGVVEEIQAKLKEKKQQVKVVLPAKLQQIKLDENMIRQVFINLLSNASKYSPEKSTIQIRLKIKDDAVLCEIEDKGYGIPSSQQKKVFSKFFRADNITNKVSEGNGLGLYLVKEIVKQSGGKIWFESKENKGTTFYFTLPLKGTKARVGEVNLEK
jgi:PAS domain S-box-containing protein